LYRVPPRAHRLRKLRDGDRVLIAQILSEPADAECVEIRVTLLELAQCADRVVNVGEERDEIHWVTGDVREVERVMINVFKLEWCEQFVTDENKVGGEFLEVLGSAIEKVDHCFAAG